MNDGPRKLDDEELTGAAGATEAGAVPEMVKDHGQGCTANEPDDCDPLLEILHP